MSSAKQQFLSPVGRLVQGHPMEKQEKNMQGQPLRTQAGEPTQKYFCALAFAKTDPAFPAFYQQLAGVAKQSFPQLFDAAGNCTHPRFSWKLVDGDSTIPDDSGRAPCTKEGFPGNWVVRFQSSFPPKCFNKGMYQPHEQIQDMNVIRRGYYGRVSGTIEGNNNAQKPGLYVNLSMFELAAQGIEIVSGPDAASVFGAAPVAALPAGATALPVGGAMPAAMPAMPGQQAAVPGLPAMPGMPGVAAPQLVPGAQAAMPAMPAAQPQAPAMPGMPATAVQPNPAFVNGPAPGGMPAMPGMPAVPAAPVVPQAPAEPTKTAAWPQPFTYAQMVGNGWNDAALRQAGYIV